MLIAVLILNGGVKPQAVGDLIRRASGGSPINYNFYQFEENSVAGIASDNVNTIYLSTLDGKIIAFDLSVTRTSGNRQLWSADLGGRIIGSPLYSNESVFVVGKSGSSLIARSLVKKTGITRMQTVITNDEKIVSAIEKVNFHKHENQLIFIFDNGAIYSLDEGSGRIVWSKNLRQTLSAVPYLEGDKLFLGTDGKQIIGLSVNGGRQLFSLDVSAPPTFVIREKTADSLLVGDRNGLLSSVNWRKNSQTRKFRVGGEISGIARTPSGLLISSFDNFVYLLSNSGGKLIWRTRMAGRIAAAPVFNNEFAVVIAGESAAASIFELRSGKLFDKVTLRENDFFIGAGLRLGNVFLYLTRTGVASFSVSQIGIKKPDV